jgi:hypothetical protein
MARSGGVIIARAAQALLLSMLCAVAIVPWRAPAASTLKFCNLRSALSTGQAEYVAGIALFGDQIDRYVFYRGADDTTFSVMTACAREVRGRVCTDRLFMDFIDPGGALLGAAAGVAVDARNGPSVLGGLLGAGVVGSGLGVVKLSMCNKAIEERYAPTLRSLGPITVPNDLGSLQYSTFADPVRDAMRTGRLPPQEGAELLRMTDQIAAAARASR